MTGPDDVRLPLEGVRVAAITVVWAGPYVTQVLGEWGADIVRVEPVNRIQPYSRGGEAVLTEAQGRAFAEQGMLRSAYPDFRPGEDPWNRSPGFNAHARNKRSMACDVMSPEGRAAFLRLIEHCDVFVENNVPETIERAGLTYEALQEVNPRLIVLRMPAYGLDGPYKNYRAFGTHVEGMIGHHLIRSYPDQTPDATGDAFTADAFASVMGAFAVTAALRHRERTGIGQQIEMPLAEAFLPALGEYILDYTMNGRVTGQLGNSHASHAPHGVYPTAGDDRWIAIDVASDEEFAALCDVLVAPELASDARFAEAPTRWANADDLDGALASEQLAARDWFEEIDYPGVGKHRYPGLLFRMQNTPNAVRTPPPKLGEHSREIYLDLLGYSEEEYADLEARGFVGEGYAPGVIPQRPD